MAKDDIRTSLVRSLGKRLGKFLVEKVLNIAIKGGLQGFVISLIVGKFSEEVAEPVMKLGLRKVGLGINTGKGYVQVYKLNKARDNNDSQAIDDAVDAILS